MLNFPAAPQNQAAPPNRLDLKVLDLKAVRKGSLRAFCSVRVNGIVINDVVVGEAAGRAWALLPSKPMVDRDGNLLRDADGKIRYVAMLEWSTRELQQEFSRRVAAICRQVWPDAFDAAGTP